MACALDNVYTEIFDPRVSPDQPLGLDQQQDLANIPVWDRKLLDDVYNQRQAVTPYYRFPEVDIGRDTINGFYQQVNLAAREINISNLPSEAKSWENTHLRYTHGWGAVVSSAHQHGESPMHCFLCDIDLNSKVELQIAQLEVYFGQEDYTYAVVPIVHPARLPVID